VLSYKSWFKGTQILKVFLERLVHRCGSVPWLCARNWWHSMKKRYSTTCSWAASWRRCHSSMITLWNKYDQNLSTSVSHTMVGAFRHSFRTRYIHSRNIYEVCGSFVSDRDRLHILNLASATAVWKPLVEHFNHFEPRMLRKCREFKWQPLLCMFWGCDFRWLGILNTCCMLTVIDIRCKRVNGYLKHLWKTPHMVSCRGFRVIWTSLTLRRLMSYIYGAPILDVSRSHTTTQHSR